MPTNANTTPIPLRLCDDSCEYLESTDEYDITDVVWMGETVKVYLPDGGRCVPRLVEVRGYINTATYDVDGDLAAITIVDADDNTWTVPFNVDLFTVGDPNGR